MKYKCIEEDILKSSPTPYIVGEICKTTDKKNVIKINSISETLKNILDTDETEIVGEEKFHILDENKSIDIFEHIINGKKVSVNIKNSNSNFELISTNLYDNSYVIWFVDKNEQIEHEINNKIRGDFFANLSHELRTPLNIIFSSLQVLDLKLKKEDQSITKYINMATQNTYRLLKLVNNLIDSNKITSGYFEYNPQNYDIVYFVESICQSIVDFAKQKNIEVIFDTDVEEKIISFDLDKMERIILNILSNSIKFTKEQGKIEIYIRESNEMLEIEISDDGIGIPQNKLNSIFERFKQVENNTIRSGEGSGIGLYLVKSLVDMHGGDIAVESELGSGTTFKISIPVELEEEYECNIMEKNLQNSYIEKIKVEFSDIYA
ncbi:HAMP domain-containing histidine kinase [Paraclostridium bifermentans]|uniref:histidine kinase n=1 Tax=Paraclostridium bifermentans TaxID=1490 RepID=A0AA44DKE9_PARBF|nr:MULTISPECIES: HAMP domain-containing sensor histidine kinase [Paraclostridium]MBN8046538.1 HAMP domain-containing histidine kinase [Paraclostridium bifermentans]MBZ6004921.1 HAMP domain-containing histidine kinase [Paraclostridium bifermentans]MCR1875040.1 HAMP domain-containing histidine kinase [Paraclostridium bifermentans]MDU0296747.1 HAMP domain-containing sensor histidine kinase [Paraclostridium sp. MRS3W1]NME09393.1 HAMP domain-containing histidine kinase [Paraclostridium bifermentans